MLNEWKIIIILTLISLNRSSSNLKKSTSIKLTIYTNEKTSTTYTGWPRTTSSGPLTTLN